jgi:hypothetical protein
MRDVFMLKFQSCEAKNSIDLSIHRLISRRTATMALTLRELKLLALRSFD